MNTGRHWKAVCSLPKYSFFKDLNENVCRVETNQVTGLKHTKHKRL